MVPEMMGFAVFPHKRIISQRSYSSQTPQNDSPAERGDVPCQQHTACELSTPVSLPQLAVKAKGWCSALAQGEDRQIQPSVPSVARPLRSSPKCAPCLHHGTGSFSQALWQCLHWECASQVTARAPEQKFVNSKTIVAFNARVRQHSSLQILPFQAF